MIRELLVKREYGYIMVGLLLLYSKYLPQNNSNQSDMRSAPCYLISSQVDKAESPRTGFRVTLLVQPSQCRGGDHGSDDCNSYINTH